VEKNLKEPVNKGAPVQPTVSPEKKSAAVRRASKEEFEKSQRKITKLHAGLFQRLAK
jgi:hypothetical protein